MTGPRVLEALVGEALALVETDPRRSAVLLDEADAAGLAGAGPRLQGLAAWGRGRAAHHLGQRSVAGRALRSAVDLLDRSGDREAWARAAVSLAVEKSYEAEFDQAVDLVDRAAAHLTGGEAARAMAQKALVLQRAGRVVDALDCWNEVVDAFRGAGMGVEEAVARQNRGIVHIYRGELEAAGQDLGGALSAFTDLGQPVRAMEVRHNLGLVAARRGDLPQALSLFDAAQAEASRLGALRPQNVVDRVEVTLDAGLVVEGRALAESGVDLLEKAGFEADVPEACLLAARACEEDGDLEAAARWAERAAARFRAQGRPRWHLLARYAAVRIHAASRPTTAAADELLATADELYRSGWHGQAVEARARAVTLLVDGGRAAEASDLLAALVATVRRSPPLGRLDIRLVEAHLCLATGDLRRARRALLSAFRALQAFQETLGSIELRSHAAGRADRLVSLGFSIARASGRPGEALWWAESVRLARSGDAPAQGQDSELLRLLEALRDVKTQVGADDVDHATLNRLRRRQAGLEELVRRRSRQQGGPGGRPRIGVRSDRITAAFAGHSLVEFALVGERLSAVVVEGCRPKEVDLAPAADVRRVVAGLRLALRSAVGGPPDPTTLRALGDAGRAVEDLLISPLRLADPSRVVVVADGPLASVPWSLLPSLEGSDLTVVPSASAWMSASAAQVAATGPVLVVAGPGLRHSLPEAEAVARIWGDATVLAGSDATVATVVAGMRSARVVHVAAHGTHRGDNPLLSGIRLADGDLTGYDIAARGVAPAVVVLSCCDIGMVETGSGIGLAQIFTRREGSTAIASVSPLLDVSGEGMMSDLHRRLAAGRPPSQALAETRAAVGGPLHHPSAAGLVCFGAGRTVTTSGSAPAGLQ